MIRDAFHAAKPRAVKTCNEPSELKTQQTENTANETKAHSKRAAVAADTKPRVKATHAKDTSHGGEGAEAECVDIDCT